MSIFNVLPHIHAIGSSPIHALLVLTIKQTDKNDGKISLGLIYVLLLCLTNVLVLCFETKSPIT